MTVIGNLLRTEQLFPSFF